MDKPKVYIIILNWNQAQDTIQCLDSLKMLDYGNFEIIVVDNGSQDGSPDEIKRRFPNILLIKNERNLGFAEGNNVGIRYVLGEKPGYIFLLNNDTVVDRYMLKELVNVAQTNEKIGIVGAVNFYFDQPHKAYSTGTSFNWWTGFTKSEPLQAITGGRLTETQESLSVPGSSLLIKTEVIGKIGLLDSKFFIYYGETDWCSRAIKAGYKVCFVPKAKILHKVSMTFGTKTPKEYYLYTRNLGLFMIKNNRGLSLVTFFIFYLLKIFFRITFLYFINKREQSKAIWMGFADFVNGKFGKGRLDEV